MFYRWLYYAIARHLPNSRKPVVGILVKGKTPPSDACIDNFFHNILGFAIIFPLQRYKYF